MIGVKVGSATGGRVTIVTIVLDDWVERVGRSGVVGPNFTMVGDGPIMRILTIRPFLSTTKDDRKVIIVVDICYHLDS
jgi:hypothetical protein